MRTKSIRGLLLAIGLVAASAPCAAQGPALGPEVALLGRAGAYLLGQLVAYVGGKMLDPIADKLLGRDTEKKLRDVEGRLQNQLNRGTADQAQVAQQLDLTRTELRVLQRLMAKVPPTSKKLAHDREELAAGLKLIQHTLAEHEKRLAEHDRLLTELRKTSERQGQQLQDLESRLNESQPRLPPGWLPPAASPVPSYPVPPSAESTLPASVLSVQVRGQANLIRLREAAHPVPVGAFRISQNGIAAVYYLPPASRAVIDLFAPGNRISMPAHLAQRVTIQSHGWYYETLAY